MDPSERRNPIHDLCRRYRVERLSLFGSAASGEFHSGDSDLDFLVILEDQPATECAENYLGLGHDLERLFNRRVDLVTESPSRNRSFREAVRSQRQLLYDRRDEKALA